MALLAGPMRQGIRLSKQILEFKFVLLTLGIEFLNLVCNLVSAPEIQCFLCYKFSLIVLRVISKVIVVLVRNMLASRLVFLL